VLLAGDGVQDALGVLLEILLDVFGASRRWFAALEARDGEWVRSFEDACGSGSVSAN